MQNQARSERLHATASAFSRLSALFDPVRLHAWDRQGLTVTQLRLLFHLSQRDGMGNAELAELLYVTRPSVSALLDRLERGGFIRREIDPQDRRGIRIFLEPRGRDAVNSFREETREYTDHLFEGLSDDELDALRVSLERAVEVALPGKAAITG